MNAELAEYPERDLEEELRRRAGARAIGLCDYCERSTESASCKFGNRHRDSRIVVPPKAFRPDEAEKAGTAK